MREPSLGPCFGIKGGATGGGASQVHPSDDINYHFTGDIHAVTYAHNLLASLVDNSLYFKNPLNIDKNNIPFPRVIDLNDRALKDITLVLHKSKSPSIKRKTRFDISVSSEVMAILCLSKDINDLQKRLSQIIVAYDKKDNPIKASDLKAQNAMTLLLKDALIPNLVQTSTNTPAIVHGGPFANIAHGTASLKAINLARSLSPYSIVEAGFGADLGAEKFFNIASRVGNFQVSATVLVTTTKAIYYHGLDNLKKHIDNLKSFGPPVIIALNRFTNDDNKIINQIKNFAKKNNIPIADSFVYQKGASGGLDLASLVKAQADKPLKKHNYSYHLSDSIEEKILKVAKKIYGAKNVSYSSKAKKNLIKYNKITKNPFICTAKTQYSFSHDPDLTGAPSNYTFKIRELRLSNGANFVIPVAGNLMTMPGLPKHPRCQDIKI